MVWTCGIAPSTTRRSPRPSPPWRSFVTVAGLHPLQRPGAARGTEAHHRDRLPGGRTHGALRVALHRGVSRGSASTWAGCRSSCRALAVVTVNVLPGHRAVMEGDLEIVLTGSGRTPHGSGRRWIAPAAAELLSDQHRRGARAVRAGGRSGSTSRGPHSVWDLYCGVGGFAVHCASPGSSHHRRGVVGTGGAQCACDRRATWWTEGVPGAEQAALCRFRRHAVGDRAREPADVVIVNPPRRGIGPNWQRGSSQAARAASSTRVAMRRRLARDLARDAVTGRPSRGGCSTCSPTPSTSRRSCSLNAAEQSVEATCPCRYGTNGSTLTISTTISLPLGAM